MPAPAAAPVAHPPRSARWPRLLLAALLASLALAAWLSPSLRNYYGKRGEVVIRSDVPYVDNSRDPKQQLDLYLPRQAGVRFPLVVFVHGGYWTAFDRRWFQPLLGAHGNVGVALARQGIGVAVIGYRQYPRAQTGRDSLDDIAAAARFVRAHAIEWGGDPAQLFLMGHSAGGQLVSLLALDRARGDGLGEVAGFISVAGIFDLPGSLRYFKPAEAAVLRQLFGPDDATLASYSPISYARGDHPPLLLVDGTGDDPVCLDGLAALRARLTAAGSPARFVELPGASHMDTLFQIGMERDQVTPVVREFIRAILASKGAPRR